MISHLNEDFDKAFKKLPKPVQDQAKRDFRLFIENPFHASLHFKQVRENPPWWSVRIGRAYRALGVRKNVDTIVWFWIGTHTEYNRLIANP